VRAGADIDEPIGFFDQRRQNVGGEHINREGAGNSGLGLHPPFAIADAGIVDYKWAALVLATSVGVAATVLIWEPRAGRPSLSRLLPQLLPDGSILVVGRDMQEWRSG